MVPYSLLNLTFWLLLSSLLLVLFSSKVESKRSNPSLLAENNLVVPDKELVRRLFVPLSAHPFLYYTTHMTWTRLKFWTMKRGCQSLQRYEKFEGLLSFLLYFRKMMVIQRQSLQVSKQPLEEFYLKGKMILRLDRMNVTCMLLPGSMHCSWKVVTYCNLHFHC